MLHFHDKVGSSTHRYLQSMQITKYKNVIVPDLNIFQYLAQIYQMRN